MYLDLTKKKKKKKKKKQEELHAASNLVIPTVHIIKINHACAQPCNRIRFMGIKTLERVTSQIASL